MWVTEPHWLALIDPTVGAVAMRSYRIGLDYKKQVRWLRLWKRCFLRGSLPEARFRIGLEQLQAKRGLR